MLLLSQSVLLQQQKENLGHIQTQEIVSSVYCFTRQITLR